MTTSSPRYLSTAASICALLCMASCGVPENTGPAPSRGSSPSVAAEVVSGDGTFARAEDADRSDVDSTAEVAALMLHSWDTLTDRTQTAAAIRAKPLMSDAWASNQIEPERNGAQRAWLEPGRYEAYSSPSIIPATGDVNRDVDEHKAIRAYDVSWKWISRNGPEIRTSGRQIATIYLEKHHGMWDVVGHQLQAID